MTTPGALIQQKTIVSTTDDWMQTLDFAQYDPASGPLAAARFTVAGTIAATAAIENLSPAAASVTLVASATIGVATPVGPLTAATPGIAATITLGAFDGTVDAAGPSGTVVAGTATDIATTAFVPNPAGVGSLSGTGTFAARVTSVATSLVRGNANLSAVLHASTDVTVSLRYDPVQPAGSDGSYNSGDYAGGRLTSFVSAPFLIANTATTAPQTVTLASRTTGWTDTAVFAQFDPALGALREIRLNVGNTVAGAFSAENLEAVPFPVAMTESARVAVGTPAMANAVTATASGADAFALGAFDGAADFAGASGRTDAIADAAAAHADGNAVLTDAVDLSAFAGGGTIALPVGSTGSSVVSGPGNLASVITQKSGATVTVSYVYVPAATTGTASPTELVFSVVPSPAPAPPPTLAPLTLPVSLPPPTPPVDPATVPLPTQSAVSNVPTPNPPAPPVPLPTPTPTLSTDATGGVVIDLSTGAAGGAALQPNMAFLNGITTTVRPNHAILVDAGIDNATINGFSVWGGDKLDLTAILAGAGLAHDNINIGDFVGVTGRTGDASGLTTTCLSFHGPRGAATVALTGSAPITAADLLNGGALILPAH